MALQQHSHSANRICVRRKLRVINQNAKGLQKSKFRSTFSQRLSLTFSCVLRLDRKDYSRKALRAWKRCFQDPILSWLLWEFLPSFQLKCTYTHTLLHNSILKSGKKTRATRWTTMSHASKCCCNTATLFKCGKKATEEMLYSRAAVKTHITQCHNKHGFSIAQLGGCVLICVNATRHTRTLPDRHWGTGEEWQCITFPSLLQI